MKNIILILTLAFTAPTFAETDSWVKVTDDFEISRIIEANPIWSDTVSMVLGGSGGGGTTGAIMFMAEPLGGSGSGGITGVQVTKIESIDGYRDLLSSGKFPINIESNQLYMNMNTPAEIGILIEDEWISTVEY
jgi:hypothetical protein